ncbi:MAG: penicillin-binding protein 1C, partial [Gemmobacter sp.]
AAPILFEVFARLKRAPDPLPPPPPAALTVPTAALPPPLQRFRPRGAALADDGPAVAFPPDGAEVALDGAPLLARVRGGIPPFTWLADGVPLAIGTESRDTLLSLAGPGYVGLAVIDAEGRAARVTVRLAR